MTAPQARTAIAPAASPDALAAVVRPSIATLELDAAPATVAASLSIIRRASVSRNCFWYCSGLMAVRALK